MGNRIICLLLLTTAFFAGCKNSVLDTDNDYNIIPHPAELTPKSGSFTIDRNTVIHADTTYNEVRPIIRQLKESIDLATGYNLGVEIDPPAESAENIMQFIFNEDTESYPNQEA